MSEWDEDLDDDYQKENERFERLIEQSHIDIQVPEFRGMEDRAKFYLGQGRKSSKSERKLARDLIKCVNWIKREIEHYEQGQANRVTKKES
jgi:hypothetical protein